MRVEIRPAFDEAVMAAELPIRKATAKILKTLQQIDLSQLWTHPGLNFEKLHGRSDLVSGNQLYSLRITQSGTSHKLLVAGANRTARLPAHPTR